MLAGVFPLIANVMFKRMTFSTASSLLGGIVSCDADADAGAHQNNAQRLTDIVNRAYS